MPDTYRLPAIPYLRLRVTMRAAEPAVLPEYHGSMLRGAFGHALRRTVCTMGPRQPCVSCQLRRACAYTRIFETFVEDEPPPFLRGIDQPCAPMSSSRGGAAGRSSSSDPVALPKPHLLMSHRLAASPAANSHDGG